MTHNAIHPQDEIKIEMYLEGRNVYTYQGTGFHNIEEVIDACYNASSLTDRSAEDYVFTVTNLTNGTSARYRINAGHHEVILPEERP